MKTLDELSRLPRWPRDGHIVQWNRGSGLWEMCIDAFGTKRQDDYQIADLGVAYGISTQIFAHFGQVLGVDHQLWAEAKELIGAKNITLLENDTLEAAEFLKGRQTFDLVYHDSRHDEEFLVREIEAWLPLIRKGGCVAGHDYNPEWPGVQMAVMKVLGGPDLVFCDSSWLKRL